MGLSTQLLCLQTTATPANVAARAVEILADHQWAEATDSDAERFIGIAQAGDGWVIVQDHLQELRASMSDPEGVSAELSAVIGGRSIDVIVADSDDLLFLVHNDDGMPGIIEVTKGDRINGDLQPLQTFLLPGKSLDDLRTVLTKKTTFVEHRLKDLLPVIGIDFAAFDNFQRLLRGDEMAGSILVRLKRVAASSTVDGASRLEVDERLRPSFPPLRIPVGLVGHTPGISFQSRGAAAQGIEVRLTGSAIENGLVELVAVAAYQQLAIDNKSWSIEARAAPKGIFRFDEFKAPVWVAPPDGHRMRDPRQLLVFPYFRALKEGSGEVQAEARLIEPASPPVSSSYQLTVPPPIWTPLKAKPWADRLFTYLALNERTHVSAMVVLSASAEDLVSVFREAIDLWLGLPGKEAPYSVTSSTEPPFEHGFYLPMGDVNYFTYDPSKQRQTKWNNLLGGIGGLSQVTIMSPRTQAISELLAPQKHPRLPEFADRLAHVTIGLPTTPEAEVALTSFVDRLFNRGLLIQAHIAASVVGGGNQRTTCYERASDLEDDIKVARGWGTRYLRSIADKVGVPGRGVGDAAATLAGGRP